ncbi:toxin-activating lysine-acyltransferase [Herbaspirillum sp.]|uniref:toxin-activating lysine-acyltransferase n=1 Tax=Herbaspirillum sp. TaxID=1890675 RepID=UPI0031DBC476
MASASRFEILAPRLIDGEFNEATAFGSVSWLWLHSERHRNIPLHTLATLLLPAIKQRKFVMVSEGGKPVFYMSWADMDEEAESRYLRHSPEQMRSEDWDSGERMWVLDWVAPFGHSRLMSRLIRGRLFARCQLRSLYHKGSDSGLRIKEMHGVAVHPREARAWFDTHPVAIQGAAALSVTPHFALGK